LQGGHAENNNSKGFKKHAAPLKDLNTQGRFRGEDDDDDVIGRAGKHDADLDDERALLLITMLSMLCRGYSFM
jgi:hypothetical protein